MILAFLSGLFIGLMLGFFMVGLCESTGKGEQ